jgi:hypothetical protein
MKRALALLALACAFAPIGDASPAHADPIAEDAIPPDLRAWIPWVLDGSDTYGCTAIGDRLQCTWPGALSLDLDARGGRFRQDIVADRLVDVWLPGDLERWPVDVKVDGRAAPVLDAGDGNPYLRVGEGTHRVDGAFRWPALP